jgi:hypothetical protein
MAISVKRTALAIAMGMILGPFTLAALAATDRPIRIPLPARAINLDPSGVQDSHSLWVSRQLNCQLVKKHGREIVLDAAKKIKTLSPTEFEVELSDEARFHDGTPLSAEDVATTFQYLKKSSAAAFSWLRDAHSSGPKTVVIDTTQPLTGAAEYLNGVNNSIFPAGFLKKAEKDPSLWKNPPGCGPYQIEEFSKNLIRLKPVNPTSGARPVEFVMLQSKELSPEEAKTFDLIDLPFSEKLGNQPDFHDASVFDPKQVYIGFNTQLKEWKETKNRCTAFSKIDRDPILSVYAGIGEKATNFFPRGVVGYHPGQNAFPTEGALPPQQKPFCVAFLGLSVPVEQRQAYVKALEPVFGKGNVRTEVIERGSEFGKKFLESGCDSVIFGMKSTTLDGYAFLATFIEPATNFSGYKDAALRSEIITSQTISDAGQRALAYQAIAGKLQDKCLADPLITIPRRKLLVKDSLSTPGLGEAPTADYSLEGVR